MLKPQIALAALTLFAATHAQAPSVPAPRVEKVVDGVFVAIRPEPAGVFLDANSVFIVGPDDVIVVDTNATPSSARASIEALKKITPKPVRAVINTHWHQDHISGNRAYRDAFPKAEFIAHAGVAKDASAPGVSNRTSLASLTPPLLEEMRMSLDQKKSMGGGALADDERESHVADIDRAQRYLSESASLEALTPTRLVDGRLTLTQGARTIDVIAPGRGHSPVDLIVHLPRERVVIAGDLVAAPVPMIPSNSVPSELVKSINAVIALTPSAIVPGHGAVMRDDLGLRKEILLIDAILRQVQTAVAGGATERQVRAMVNVDALRQDYAGGSTFRAYLFNLYAFQPGVTAAFREISARK